MGTNACCRRRRWVTCVALGGYALVMSGLPLPLGLLAGVGRPDAVGDRLLAAKDRSRPFPCRDKPCGCVSADQCFKKCCCHTPAQLLAWARRNDLEPAVLATLERRAATEVPVAVIASAASCCTTPKVVAKATCCVADASPAASSQVSTDSCSNRGSSAAVVVAPATAAGDLELHATAEVSGDFRSLSAAADAADGCAAAADDGPVEEPAEEPVSNRTVVLRSMLACGGIVADWFSIGGAPPPPAVVAVACVSPVAVTLVDRDEPLRPRHVAPDVPPPRVA
jgi:hypothetical protein